MTIGIIGYGRFGQLWAEHLSTHADVLVFDKTTVEIPAGSSVKEATLEEVCDVDMLFPIVPIRAIESCCNEIKELVRDDTIIVDVCSVKVHPADVMQQTFRESQEIIATHPLFGPDSVGRDGMPGQRIVVCPVRATEVSLDLLQKLLRKLELKVILSTPEEHDQQMATSQALIFFLGRGLSALKLQDQEISTPAYRSLIEIHDLVSHDTEELFFDMQRFNPYTQKIRSGLVEALASVEHDIQIYE